MKINTITCHEVYNHGATLQEYALLKYLNENGHYAETIHYKPDYLSGHFKLWAVSNPKFDKPFIKQLYLLAKLSNRLISLKRKNAFDQFHAKYIPTGKIKYSSNEEIKLSLPEADAFICGSDQIWNSFFANGKDPAFYLNFVPKDKIKISYAASFAQDEIAEEVKQLVKENVANLDSVSVRETSGVSILQDLGIKNAVQVLDPVFLLGAEHWINNFVCPIKEKFIFVYDFDSNPLIKEIAMQFKKEKRYKIYTVNKNIDYADRNFNLKGPEYFLSLVYNSQYNITNSFHSVAFSLVFNKQFVVVNRTEKINTRMRDLLNLFQLPNLVDSFEEFQKLKMIDYNSVNPKIESSVNSSKSFLTSALKF
jgi:hypothetical protein